MVRYEAGEPLGERDEIVADTCCKEAVILRSGILFGHRETP